MLFPKQVLVRDRKYLNYVKTLPCYIRGCTNSNIDPHHLMIKEERGMGRKASDIWATPACRQHHNQATNMQDEDFFELYGFRYEKVKADAIQRYENWKARKLFTK
jgi:hypothetical protein